MTFITYIFGFEPSYKFFLVLYVLIYNAPKQNHCSGQQVKSISILPLLLKKRGKQTCNKKSCIRETSNLSTDADSSTNTTVGWTKNTQNQKNKLKRKTLSKTEKLKKRLEICQN